MKHRGPIALCVSTAIATFFLANASTAFGCKSSPPNWQQFLTVIGIKHGGKERLLKAELIEVAFLKKYEGMPASHVLEKVFSSRPWGNDCETHDDGFTCDVWFPWVGGEESLGFRITITQDSGRDVEDVDVVRLSSR